MRVSVCILTFSSLTSGIRSKMPGARSIGDYKLNRRNMETTRCGGEQNMADGENSGVGPLLINI